MSQTHAESGYAPVNGLEMYYEIHDTGRPLFLLHGALSAIGTSFGRVLPGLARTRQVIAVELFRLLGGGVMGDVAGLPRSRLAILPGTTHITVADRGDWLASMITEFLDAPMPASG